MCDDWFWKEGLNSSELSNDDGNAFAPNFPVKQKRDSDDNNSNNNNERKK